MKEVRGKFKAELFDMDRLERIEALRKVIGKYSVLFKGEDGQLITDALAVHAALIRIVSKGNGNERET